MNEAMKLEQWDRGLKLASRSDTSLFTYLWFYEWLLFDAVEKGEHRSGNSDWLWSIDGEGRVGTMDAGWLKTEVVATERGATLKMEVRNDSDHDWPDIAALIPCLSPGDPGKPAEHNTRFVDETHVRTYFQGRDGLELVAGEYPREIHFNCHSWPSLDSWDKESEDDAFLFESKWPLSDRDAYAGIMVRESDDGRSVMGMGWDSYLSAQGHNPWKCMHLSVRVGPLRTGAQRTINGELYLFHGSITECLEAFEQDMT